MDGRWETDCQRFSQFCYIQKAVFSFIFYTEKKVIYLFKNLSTNLVYLLSTYSLPVNRNIHIGYMKNIKNIIKIKIMNDKAY